MFYSGVSCQVMIRFTVKRKCDVLYLSESRRWTRGQESLESGRRRFLQRHSPTSETPQTGQTALERERERQRDRERQGEREREREGSDKNISNLIFHTNHPLAWHSAILAHYPFEGVLTKGGNSGYLTTRTLGQLI